MNKPLRNILIVDDESSLRNLLSLALKTITEESDTAADGQEALEKIVISNYDVILADISMPRLSGTELVNQIRQKGNQTPVILCSAHFPDEAFAIAERDSTVKLMAKPMSLPAIRELVLQVGNKEFA